MSELIEQARAFAIAAHENIGHRRKYTDEPYWVHPQAVAELVASVCDDPTVIAVAWLHDTVEDTPVSLQQIESRFGERVAALVEDLTDISCLADGNRARRKSLDRQHTAAAHPHAKTVKLADLIHNTQSIVEHAPGFARIYLEEKRMLLEVLQEGDSQLYEQACAQLRQSLRILATKG
ncbi:MAG: HD domain-containing protein [Motiliproteus sp.]|nr:HD domain-containing protein [Motiliproteus sp.]